MLRTLRKPILHPSALIHGLITDAIHFVRNISKQKNKASKHRSPENVEACKLIAKKYKQVIKKTKKEYYKKTC